MKGNLDKAITSMRRAVNLDPKFALAWAGLGEAYWRQARNNGDKQNAELALESAQRAVQLDPDLVIAHTVLGTIYGAAGRNDEAIRELQIALKIAPGNAGAPRELARIYDNLGRFQEAEAAYLKAVKASPTDWYGYLLLGLFYNGRERYQEAENAFKRAMEMAPDNEIAARNLGGLYMMEGKYSDAINVLLKSLKVRQNAHTYGALAATYFYQHRFQDAATAMETAVDLDSSRYEYWGNLGIYYKWIPGAGPRITPALRRAIELAEKRLEVTPTDYGIHANLAEYQARLRDSRAAMAEIGRIPEAARQPLASRLAIAYELIGPTHQPGQPESDQGRSRSRAAMGGSALPASDPAIAPPVIGVARHWILTDNAPGGFGQIHLRLVQHAGETGEWGIACEFCHYQVQLSNDHVQLRDLFVHISASSIA